jgi:hypothetical protein
MNLGKMIFREERMRLACGRCVLAIQQIRENVSAKPTSETGVLPEQVALRAGRRFKAELAIRVRCRDTALRSSLNVAFHD